MQIEEKFFLELTARFREGKPIVPFYLNDLFDIESAETKNLRF